MGDGSALVDFICEYAMNFKEHQARRIMAGGSSKGMPSPEQLADLFLDGHGQKLGRLVKEVMARAGSQYVPSPDDIANFRIEVIRRWLEAEIRSRGEMEGGLTG